jgi:hypothetical protein
MKIAKFRGNVAPSIIFAGGFLLAFAGLLAGCTHSSNEAGPPAIQIGKPAFAFDAKQTFVLNLAKADPKSGDHWSTRVERVVENPASSATPTFHDSDSWRIKTYSESSTLQDRRANRGWIVHLLDTLTTFRANSKLDVQNPSSEVKARFGLYPPRYVIQWQALDAGTHQPRTFEIRIGSPVDPERAPYGESFGILPPSPDIYRVNGATMAMLEYLKNFSGLRQEVLSTLESDDVDELELKQNARKLLYAQREGDRWTDEKHHRVKANAAALLDRITHLRIARFIDDPIEAAARSRILAKPLYTVILKDRYSHPVELRFGKAPGGVVIASESLRPNAVFEMYPDTLRHLQP